MKHVCWRDGELQQRRLRLILGEQEVRAAIALSGGGGGLCTKRINRQWVLGAFLGCLRPLRRPWTFAADSVQLAFTECWRPLEAPHTVRLPNCMRDVLTMEGRRGTVPECQGGVGGRRGAGLEGRGGAEAGEGVPLD